MKSILEEPCKCLCGWQGTVYDCEPDIDGDGSLGCPQCSEIINIHVPSIHPMQPAEFDTDGVLRFKENAIVKYLLDNGPFDLNHLVSLPFDTNDWNQFAQLIGYSVSGYLDLSYVSEDSKDRVEAIYFALDSPGAPPEKI